MINLFNRRPQGTEDIMTLRRAVHEIYGKMVFPDKLFLKLGTTDLYSERMEMFFKANKKPTVKDVRQVAWEQASSIHINCGVIDYDKLKRKRTMTARQYVDFYREKMINEFKDTGYDPGCDKMKNQDFINDAKCSICGKKPQKLIINRDPRVLVIAKCDACGLSSTFPAMNRT